MRWTHAVSGSGRTRLHSSPHGEGPEVGLGETEGHPVHSGILGPWRALSSPTADRAVSLPALLIGVAAGAVLMTERSRPLHVVDPRARVALETVIVLSAIAAGGRLIANFRRDRKSRELLVLCAVLAMSLTDFAYGAAPALLGLRSLPLGDSAWLGGVMIAGAFR